MTAADGDYTLLTFEIPAGTAEIQIAHSDGSEDVILDRGSGVPTDFVAGAGLTDDAIIRFSPGSDGERGARASGASAAR